jgi:ribosomal protein L12E/L44/L45/RPP1/RPP2
MEGAGALLLAPLWAVVSLSSLLRLAKSKERQVETTSSTSNASEDGAEEEEEEEEEGEEEEEECSML